MIFTETALPSAAETHGSHRPKVTAPFASTAPSVPSGRRFTAMASQGTPLDAAEEDTPAVRLQADEPRLLRGRGLTAARRLRVTGEVELIHHLSIKRDGEVSPV